MRVCYFGTYDPAFARNKLLIAGLRAVGATVLECRAELWQGTADKLAAARGAGPGFAVRLARAWRRLADMHHRVGPYDVLVVGYAGHLDVLLAHALSRRVGCPVVLDAFVSLAETFDDRGLAPPRSARRQAARLLDQLACRRADRVLVDTTAHAAYFRHALRVPAERLAVVPMGAWPRQPLRPAATEPWEALYFGSYIPLHGLEYVLDAARQLRDLPDVQFTLVGDGQELAACQSRARAWGLQNVVFAPGWMTEDELVRRYVARARVCLGIFGSSAKAARVVPAKALLALACGRPLVTEDSPAAPEAFVGRQHAVLCRPADGQALAAALRRLHADPALCARLAAAGPALVSACYTPEPLGRRLQAVLADACSHR